MSISRNTEAINYPLIKDTEKRKSAANRRKVVIIRRKIKQKKARSLKMNKLLMANQTQ